MRYHSHELGKRFMVSVVEPRLLNRAKKSTPPIKKQDTGCKHPVSTIYYINTRNNFWVLTFNF